MRIYFETTFFVPIAVETFGVWGSTGLNWKEDKRKEKTAMKM